MLIKTLIKFTGTLPIEERMPYNHMDDYIELIFKEKSESDAKKVRKASIFV